MQYPNIGIVILAAGASTRMGQPKQLLRYNGQSLVQRICTEALATQTNGVTLVLGANAATILPEVRNLSVQVAHNEDWEQGMSTSVKKGLTSLLHDCPKVEAVLFLLVDQPFVDHVIIKQFLNKFQQEKPLLIASDYGRNLGVPALFHQSLFPKLLQLEGAKGANRLLKQYADQAIRVPFPSAAIDLDTPEDWAQFQKTIQDS